MIRTLLIMVLFIFCGSFAIWEANNSYSTAEIPDKLSAYNFFTGPVAEQRPAKDVFSYNLNTPLFSDYAEKLRFVKVPEGKKVVYNDSTVFEFPVGTVLIKTFYFPKDFRDESKGSRLIETRLLIKEGKGWKALPYIWNEEQTDAFLDVAGEQKEVSYVDERGKKQKHAYFIPNSNQCKGCHNRSEELVPIGPSAKQLNGEKEYGAIKENQLQHWQQSGILSGLPELTKIPKAAVWNNLSSGSVEERARIWLDINCAHCHNPHGPAATSGLNLNTSETDPLKLGIYKTPVAAGRGSGNRKFDIFPGKPDESILIYRMESNDPGVMMPELGRSVMHKEGVELIKQWIRQMK